MEKVTKKWPLVLIAVLAAVILVMGSAIITIYLTKSDEPVEDSPAQLTQEYINDEIGVRMEYPDSFHASELTPDLIAAGIFFGIEKDEPYGFVTLRKEERVGKLEVLGGTVLDQLIESVNKKYSKRYADYEKEKFEEFVVANEKAALFEFSYTGTDREFRIKQRFIIIAKDNTAYYIAAQAAESDFLQFDADFSEIIESFQFIN